MTNKQLREILQKTKIDTGKEDNSKTTMTLDFGSIAIVIELSKN